MPTPLRVMEPGFHFQKKYLSTTMGMVLIYGLILLTIIIIIGIFLLIYSIRKKWKTGIAIAIVLLVLVTMGLFTNQIDSVTTTKDDIRQQLGYAQVDLQDDFRIIENSISGMPERLQTTKLLISKNDRKRIITSIEESENFQAFRSSDSLANNTNLSTDKIGESFNASCPEFYIRELSTLVDDYTTKIQVSIDAGSDTLIYRQYEE